MSSLTSKNNLLHAALFTPGMNGDWGLPITLWGPPGTTKTANVKALGARWGMHVEHLAPGERGEGAFGVTPVPRQMDNGMVLGYPPPEWVANLFKAGEEMGIVFVDELNTAPPALQPALLGALQERRIGGHRFGPRVRMLGAANPVAQSAGGWDLSAPAANRMGHIEWPSPSVDDWAAWLLSGAGAAMVQGDALKEEARVMKLWPEAFAQASGIVTGFLKARPELLHKIPKDGDPQQSRAWPSPRTWELATRAYASTIVHRLADTERDELVGAFVGTAAVGELMTFVEENDLPNPADLLDNKVKFSHDPERLDRTVVVLNACAALVAPAKAEKRDERSEVLWNIVSKVSDDAKDVVVPCAQTLVRADLRASKLAKQTLARLHSVVIPGV